MLSLLSHHQDPLKTSNFLRYFIFQAGYLTVIQPSDITKISGDLSVNEGGIARLTCEASGYPPPTIYWTREQRNEKITIWTPGRRIQGTVEHKSDFFSCVLSVVL